MFQKRLSWRPVDRNISFTARAEMERVGQNGTYRLSVQIRHLGEGRLTVNLDLKICLECLLPRRYWRCYCSDGQIRVTSDPLEISPKRG